MSDPVSMLQAAALNRDRRRRTRRSRRAQLFPVPELALWVARTNYGVTLYDERIEFVVIALGHTTQALGGLLSDDGWVEG